MWGLKFFSIVWCKSGGKYTLMIKYALFRPFFNPPERQVRSFTMKTDIEVEHYHTCVNTLVKTSHYL